MIGNNTTSSLQGQGSLTERIVKSKNSICNRNLIPVGGRRR